MWVELRTTLWLLALLTLSGCGWQMAEQPRLDPYEPTVMTARGTSALHSPGGTVARGTAEELERPALDEELIARGRERYTITCALCHGEAGDGDGRVVAHGFPQPPSFHEERLVKADDEHFYSVISNGAGRMLPYAERVSPRDRWAIAAWIRVLQISRQGGGETP